MTAKKKVNLIEMFGVPKREKEKLIVSAINFELETDKWKQLLERFKGIKNKDERDDAAHECLDYLEMIVTSIRECSPLESDVETEDMDEVFAFYADISYEFYSVLMRELVEADATDREIWLTKRQFNNFSYSICQNILDFHRGQLFVSDLLCECREGGYK